MMMREVWSASGETPVFTDESPWAILPSRTAVVACTIKIKLSSPGVWGMPSVQRLPKFSGDNKKKRP